MNNVWDVIIIGAGSVGVPLAMNLAEKNLKTLVLDSLVSPGQGNNKKAIGGIRATHSDYGKIHVCRRSIEIFSTWQDRFGDDIGWLQNGYSFPVYSIDDERKLKDLMKIQHTFGLNIGWVSAQEYNELVPGINMKNLRGATYSPEDGSASPLLAINAMYFRSLEYGASYRFNTHVTGIERQGKTFLVQSNTGQYACSKIVNAAGGYAKEICRMVGEDCPVAPDSHEGAITEPVKRFFGPMIVDMRPAKDSLNYYFYQNNEGQVVFCITPDPPISGIDDDSTSRFLPQVARRMISLYPRLAELKVRRTWRGQYPATPDGFPIVGELKSVPGFINAVGMCGQGFMLGPGLGELITRLITGELSEHDRKTLASFDPYRKFTGMEAFK